PQVYNQKPGLGFPIARLGAVISLACGAVVNLGFCRYAGKGQGEVSLLRQLWDVLTPGDVILADSLTANWTSIWMLQARGVELVSRLNKAHRTADFRRGHRLVPTTTSSAGPSRRRSARWTGRRTGRCRRRSRFGRCECGSPSRASGPSRSWW